MWYVIQVMTGKEDDIAGKLKEQGSCPEGKSSDTLRRFMVTERIHPVCWICIPEHELQCG